MSAKTGKCATCDYEPVAFDARLCPCCGARNPNPGPTNRYVARTVPAAALLGGLIGAVWGYYGFALGWVGAFGGLLLGVLPGLLLGLFAGMAAGLAVWLCGLCQCTRVAQRRDRPGGTADPATRRLPTAAEAPAFNWARPAEGWPRAKRDSHHFRQ